MSRITTTMTVPVDLVPTPVEPEAVPEAPARKPSKPDAAKADVANETEETP
jgi:hypothetical protein